MNFIGFREDLRGHWLGNPIGLGYEEDDNGESFIVYMILQEEQVIIKIENQEQTKPFRIIPIARLFDGDAEWLMDESKSKLKAFYGVEEYIKYSDEEIARLMKESEEVD